MKVSLIEELGMQTSAESCLVLFKKYLVQQKDIQVHDEEQRQRLFRLAESQDQQVKELNHFVMQSQNSDSDDLKLDNSMDHPDNSAQTLETIVDRIEKCQKLMLGELIKYEQIIENLPYEQA